MTLYTRTENRESITHAFVPLLMSEHTYKYTNQSHMHLYHY